MQKQSKLWEGADTQLDYHKGTNMNKSKSLKEVSHTPTPWKRSGPVIFTADERSRIGSTEYDDTRPLQEREIANAAFIVRCVNSHDALVEACRKTLASLTKAEKDKGIGIYLKEALKLAEEA